MHTWGKGAGARILRQTHAQERSSAGGCGGGKRRTHNTTPRRRRPRECRQRCGKPASELVRQPCGMAAVAAVMQLENVQQELRSYQQSALQRARRGNTVIVGATGIGKTEVALNLLREADYSNGRLAFFLVPNRRLAEQQLRRVKETTALAAALCVGRELDLWTMSEWQAVFAENHAIVCTHQVLLNLLEKGSEYMAISRLALLIIDECHEATKAHPCVKIMQFYARAKAEGSRLPLVFGMTATMKDARVPETLHCGVYTCDVQQTQEFAAVPPLRIVEYLPPPWSFDDSPLRIHAEMRRALPFLAEIKGENDKNYAQLAATYEQFGPWFFLKHLELFLTVVLQSGAMSAYTMTNTATAAATTTAGSEPITQLELAETLRLFLSRFLAAIAREEHRTSSTSSSSSSSGALSSSGGGSDRVRKLLHVLLEAKAAADAASASTAAASVEGQPAAAAASGFRALVFVQRRVACRLLWEYLQQHPAFHGRSGFALGEAGPKGLAGAVNVSGSDTATSGGLDKVDAASVTPTGAKGARAGVVERFDAGELELLLATSVLSQGIDVQECGLVVVLDDIPTDVAFAQMRGRARRGDGEFVVFASGYAALMKVKQLEQQADGLMRGPGTLGLGLGGAGEDLLSARYPQYMYKMPATGATLSMDNSIPYIFQVCQTSRECRSYGLMPTFDVIDTGNIYQLAFACALTLPSVFGLTREESVVHTPQSFPTKAAAKAAAAFLGCMRLREKGVFDDSLNPYPEGDILTQYPEYIPGLADGQTPLEQERVDLTPSASALGLKPLLIEQATKDGAVSQLYLHGLHAPPASLLPDRAAFAKAPIGLVTAVPLQEGGKDHLVLPPAAIEVTADQLVRLARWHRRLCSLAMHGRKCLDPSSPHSLLDAHAGDPADDDKGYLLVPMQADALEIDWGAVERLADGPLLAPLWPLSPQAAAEAADWVVYTSPKPFGDGDSQAVASFTRMYGGVGLLQGQTLGERRAAGAAAAAGAEEAMDVAEGEEEGLSEPVLIYSQYPRDVWDRCDQGQPLLLTHPLADARELFRRGAAAHDNDDADASEANPSSPAKRQRIVAVQLCQRLRGVSKSLLTIAQALMPVLWRLECELKVHAFLQTWGAAPFFPTPASLHLVRTALSRPDYERLEMLGDAYLKAATVQWATRVEPFLEREGLLMGLSSNIVCNVRLLRHAVQRGLHHSGILRKSGPTSEFRHWAPSTLAPLDGHPRVHGKVVADVVEALIGAHLISAGPACADHFLRRLGLPVLDPPSDLSPLNGLERALGAPYLLLPTVADSTDDTDSELGAWPVHFSRCQHWTPEALKSAAKIFPPANPPQPEGLLRQLASLEALLGYTFSNKHLAVEALTHPSFTFRRVDAAGRPLATRDYQRLEFLGDAILDFLVAARLGFTIHPNKQDGSAFEVAEMQVLKSCAVGNDRLCAVAVTWLQAHRFLMCDDLDLRRNVDRYARQVQQLQSQSSPVTAVVSFPPDSDTIQANAPIPGPKALADVVEALIAAVFVDCGGNFEDVAGVFLPHVLPRVVVGGEEGVQGGMKGDAGMEEDDGAKEGERVLCAADRARLERAFPELWRLCDERFPSSVLDGLGEE